MRVCGLLEGNARGLRACLVLGSGAPVHRACLFLRLSRGFTSRPSAIKQGPHFSAQRDRAETSLLDQVRRGRDLTSRPSAIQQRPHFSTKRDWEETSRLDRARLNGGPNAHVARIPAKCTASFCLTSRASSKSLQCVQAEPAHDACSCIVQSERLRD